MSAERSDEALLAAWRTGDPHAFDELYARHERPLFGFLCRLAGQRAEAEDVLHEAFMAVLREAKRGASIRSVKALLYTVARNECLRRARGKTRGDAALSLEWAALPETRTPHQALEQHEVVKALHAALATLTPMLAELYHLRASGLSYDEVAQVLSVPVGTVKSRMHELVLRLQQEVPR